jgi:hypothetical protein
VDTKFVRESEHGTFVAMTTTQHREALPPRRPSRPRRPALFTARDLTRALKAAQRAGLPIASVRIEPTGTIVILPGTPAPMAVSAERNDWD